MMLLEKIFALYFLYSIYFREVHAAKKSEDYIISYAKQMCQIRYKGQFFCGCLFITQSYVLSTAQCANRIQKEIPKKDRKKGALLIQSNSISNPQQVMFQNSFINPDFNKNTNVNDLAIIRLKNKIILDGVTAVAMSFPIKAPKEQTVCYAFNWATHTDGKEENVYPEDMKLVKPNTCKETYGNMKGRLCAVRTQESLEPCEGIYCGPLLCNGEWAGFSIEQTEANKIEEAFTNIFLNRNWLVSIVGREAIRRRSSGSNKTTYNMRLYLILVNFLLMTCELYF